MATRKVRFPCGFHAVFTRFFHAFSLRFPGNVVDSRQGELANFLRELLYDKKLVTPKGGENNAAGVVYFFLHGEEDM